MIVITMGPSGCIDLPCRYACAAVCRNRKHRFLPAASFTAAVDRHGRSRPFIGGLICRIFRTPVINFLYRLLRLQTVNPIPELRIKKGSAVSDIFIVYPIGKNIIGKNVLRQAFAPFHIFPKPQCMPHKTEKCGKCIFPGVPQRHGAIEEFHTDRLIAGTAGKAILQLFPKGREKNFSFRIFLPGIILKTR